MLYYIYSLISASKCILSQESERCTLCSSKIKKAKNQVQNKNELGLATGFRRYKPKEEKKYINKSNKKF